MAQTNRKTPRVRTAQTHTYEGAPAMQENAFARLRRVLFAHMLFEDTFYIDGKSAADMLKEAVRKAAAVKLPDDDADLVVLSTVMEARNEFNIRHASLLAALELSKVAGPEVRVNAIYGVIQRADELAEVVAMALAEKTGQKRKVSHAVRKGVARAFGKFDEYQFAKYKGEGRSVTLKDAVFITRPSAAKFPLVAKIVTDTLETPNTWEARLSGGEKKDEAFTDLLKANKLGAMALLRNLRNMEDSGVDRTLVREAMGRANWSKVLPFRFLSALKEVPGYARELDEAFQKAVAGSVYLRGSTAVLVDTSGSMAATLSDRSKVRMMDAGMALAAAMNGDHVDLYEWADRTRKVPNFRSLAAIMTMGGGAVGHGTRLEQAIGFANSHGKYDRLIVVSDMQFFPAGDPGYRYSGAQLGKLTSGQTGYAINVGKYQQAGLAVGDWTQITGWSDAVLKYIAQAEG